MSKPNIYLLVSLPTTISPANDHDEALTTLRSAVTTDNGAVFPFSIPEFKVGTLDALVRQADELAKLEDACKGVVAKVGDALRTILQGDESKIAQQKTVNDSTTAFSIDGASLTEGDRGSQSIPQDVYLEQGQIQSRQAFK